MAAKTSSMHPDERCRRLRARWSITATLDITGASQIGSHGSDYADQTFSRDSEGNVFLQGSTLAGAIRSALSDYLSGFRTRESTRALWAFGFVPRTKHRGYHGHESPIIVFDSRAPLIPTAAGDSPTALRDGVRINSHTGTASRGLKYDREVAAAPLSFPLRFDILVDETGRYTSGARNLHLSEAELLEAFAAGIKALGLNGAFGARKSRGMGSCRIGGFHAIRYDLTDPQGWEQYAASTYGAAPPDSGQGSDDLVEALRQEARRHTTCAALDDDLSSPGEQAARIVELTGQLRLTGTLLIGSPVTDPGGPDTSHLKEYGSYLLSGTALAGALRSHAERIANTLASRDHADFLDGLFGTAPERMRRGEPQASRLFVSERPLNKTKTHVQTRVAIDRFTGGTLPHFLVEEEPVVQGDVTNLRLQLRLTGASAEPKAIRREHAWIGMLLLLARDLCCGWLPVGGEASIGRGRLEGQFRVEIPGEPVAVIGPDGCDTEAADRLKPYLEALEKELKEAPHA